MSKVNVDEIFAEFGIGPEDLQGAAPKNEQAPFEFDPPPYIFPDPASIPRRQWLLGRHYVCGVVGATLGAPGRLKSTTEMTEFVGMAAGRDLLRGKPLESGPLRTAYLNGEENQDELDRRLAAILQHYRIPADACRGRLWLVSTRDNPMRRGGAVIAEDVVATLLRWCEARQIDVLAFDPLVSFHRLNENDNGAMDALIKEAFDKIAGKNRSVDLVVHPRKSAPGVIDTTVDDLRGGSAQLGAVRTARVFNFMTTAEAKKLGMMKNTAASTSGLKAGKTTPG
jgi:RecA-family ATPase